MADLPRTAEETPIASTTSTAPAVEQSTTAAEDAPAAAVTPTTAPETTDEATKKDEVAGEVIPATEGVLGYKAPGLLK